MVVDKKIDLQLSDQYTKVKVFAKQGDINSRKLTFDLFGPNQQKIVVNNEAIVVINAKRSNDGESKSFAGYVNEDGSVSFTLTNWMLAYGGVLYCSITVYDGGTKITSVRFLVDVECQENPDGAISEDDPSVDVAYQILFRLEASLEQIDNQFAGAGIYGETYTIILDTTSATTEQHANKEYPWVKVSSLEDRIDHNSIYRITFDDVKYILSADMWFSDNRNGKSATLLGNAVYWGDIQGFIHPISDVPFLVTGLMSDGSTNTEGIFLFTETVGTHSVKIEKVEYDFSKIPPILISGFPHLAAYLLNNGDSGYNAISVGENIMKHLRSTLACGTQNEVSNQLAIAFGQLNKVSGEAGKAFGRGNDVSGAGAVGIGENNTASGPWATAIGRQNTASENSATALGYYNTASGGYSMAGGAGSVASGGVSTAIGYGTVANHLCQTAIGMYNEVDTSPANAGNRGDYIEIVGNGTGNNSRSNARTLDWNGNESLAGGLTLGKGTANEVTLTAEQLKRLIDLL